MQAISLASLTAGSARNPHVLRVRSGCCALSAVKLTAPITPAALSDPGRERSAPPGFSLVV
ncbi:DNA metabolism protein [Citrobacter sp. CRE-46]|nr:DNA metabolism protein [Citrobacter sp. CRE-46]